MWIQSYNILAVKAPQECRGGGTFILILYIKKTFVYRCVLQQDDSDFEPVYIVATFLDPFLSLYLDHELRTR